MTYPCRDCTNRTVGCHSSCEQYKSTKLKYNKQNDDIKQIKSKNDEYYQIVVAPRIKNRHINKRAKKYNYGK